MKCPKTLTDCVQSAGDSVQCSGNPNPTTLALTLTLTDCVQWTGESVQ